MAFNGIELAGLWRNNSGKGFGGSPDRKLAERHPELARALEGKRILVFQNEDATDSNRRPVLKIYIVDDAKSGGGRAGGGGKVPF